MPIIGPLTHESVSVTDTATGITTTALNNMLPAAALITVETAAIRFCVDGTTASATVGHAAEPGALIELHDRGEVTKFSARRRDATSATIKVTPGAGWRAG